MITRIHKRSNPYVQIDRKTIEDTRLSWKARGLLAYLLSKPDHWTIRMSHLVQQATDGMDALKSAMVELRESGYAVLIHTKDGATWNIYEQCRANTNKPQGEKPTVAKSAASKKDKDSKKERVADATGSGASSRPPLPDSETEMERILEQNGIEPDETGNGNFFDQMHKSGWKIKGKPVKNWIHVYQARVEKVQGD